MTPGWATCSRNPTSDCAGILAGHCRTGPRRRLGIGVPLTVAGLSSRGTLPVRELPVSSRGTVVEAVMPRGD